MCFISIHIYRTKSRKYSFSRRIRPIANPNVYTYNYTHVPADVTLSSCCNKLKGKLLQSAGENTNGGTYNNTDISKTGVSSIGNYCRYWDGLKGDVPKLAPAELKIYRNIGVWRHRRDERLLVHAPSEKWDRTNQHGLARRERLGQCNFGIPRPLMNTRWQHVQGGVVNRCREQGQRDWDHSVTGCDSCSVSIKGK